MKETDSTQITLKEILKNEEYLKEDMEDDWKSQFELDNLGQTHLFFFGRTQRDKEDWYRRFVAATHKGADASKYSHDKTDDVESVSSTLMSNAALEEDYYKYMQLFQKVKPYKAKIKFSCKSTMNPLVRPILFNSHFPNSS